MVLVVGGLDKAQLPIGLQKQIVAEPLISRVRSHGFIFLPVLSLQCFEERNQRTKIGAVGEHVNAGDILAVHRDLHVIGRLELPVAHMVLLHPHERSVRVRLGIAVAALAHDAKLFRVLQTLSNAEILPGTIFLYFFCFLRSKQTDTRGAAILRYPKRRTKHGQTFSHH